MTNKVLTFRTSLSAEEGLTRAVQFFEGNRFRFKTRAVQSVTLIGRPPTGCGLLLASLIGILVFVLPGLILLEVIRRNRRKAAPVIVSVAPAGAVTEVSCTYYDWAHDRVKAFFATLPPAA